MVGGNGIGYILHQNGLSRLGLGHNQCTLSLANGSKQVYNARTEVGGAGISRQAVLLVGEEWGEVLKRYSVANLRRNSAVDFVNAGEREVLLTLMWRAHMALYYIASLEAVALDERVRHIDIIGG